MLVLFDRKIKIQTGAKSQTVNICTKENKFGTYEYRVRMHPPFFVKPDNLDEKRFGNIQEIVIYLQEQHHGKVEQRPTSYQPLSKGFTVKRRRGRSADSPQSVSAFSDYPKKIANWNGKEIEVGRSRGGVVATANPYDNLVSNGIHPWPPSEIVQKMYISRQLRAFDEQNAEQVTARFGYYSDLQSINSEDAITWSFFGTIAYASDQDKLQWTKDLFKFLSINTPMVSNVNVWLWRRIPHPDTLVSGGPEIDFGVQTDDTIVLGEAKWKSDVGKMQGKNKDKDQLLLRIEFLQKYGERFFPNAKHRVLLVVSPSGKLAPESNQESTRKGVHCSEITWDDLCSMTSHPHTEELQRYLAWKKDHSRIA